MIKLLETTTIQPSKLTSERILINRLNWPISKMISKLNSSYLKTSLKIFLLFASISFCQDVLRVENKLIYLLPFSFYILNYKVELGMKELESLVWSVWSIFLSFRFFLSKSFRLNDINNNKNSHSAIRQTAYEILLFISSHLLKDETGIG